MKKTEQKLVQNSSETRSKLVKIEQENRNLKNENETLQKENNELSEQIGDKRANKYRQTRFANVLQIYSARGNYVGMAKLAKLMANEQYDDLDEELDECLRRLQNARMRQ